MTLKFINICVCFFPRKKQPIEHIFEYFAKLAPLNCGFNRNKSTCYNIQQVKFSAVMVYRPNYN